ncbi:MAG: alpha/beta hydrolase [Actinobacteria bacterium]|nr:MAG: alpha/beta hydrolase [Actinomycetota bacterium]
MRKLLGAIFAIVTLLPATIAGAPAAAAHESRSPRRPVIFVHGFVGSGAQFETQAMRFTSNGYPADRIGVEEYDSSFATTTMSKVWDELDGLVTRMLTRSGADKVELVGHSLGTAISQGYLTSSLARAARVAHYVNLDGAPASSPPGGVPTLAVWGEGHSALQIVGATNVYQPDHSHVQVATSAETFGAMYRFFTGHAPGTTNIVAQRHVVLSGRADLFPTNAGAAGTTLQIWEVAPRTGLREHDRPEATFRIGADGAWGPFRGSSDEHYELAILFPGSTHHFYFEPFVRSDNLIRLLTQEPGTGLDALREKSATTSALIFIRYKELWGDQGAQNDALTINGQNVLTPAIAPRAKRLNALFAFDHKLDGVTDLSAPIPVFAALPFISGADVSLPASDPPDRTIQIAATPRGGGGTVENLNVPNWASSTNFTSIQLRDFVQSTRHPDDDDDSSHHSGHDDSRRHSDDHDD